MSSESGRCLTYAGGRRALEESLEGVNVEETRDETMRCSRIRHGAGTGLGGSRELNDPPGVLSSGMGRLDVYGSKRTRGSMDPPNPSNAEQR
jgi:hypothetical protein